MLYKVDVNRKKVSKREWKINNKKSIYFILETTKKKFCFIFNYFLQVGILLDNLFIIMIVLFFSKCDF